MEKLYIYNRDILPAIIAEGIKQYSTNDNPNITEDEQYFFKTGIFEKYMQVPDIQIHRTSGYETSGEVVRDANYSAFERFMEYYSDERSDGGKDITPNEYTKIMTSFLEANYWVTKSVLQNENGNDKSFWKFW